MVSSIGKKIVKAIASPQLAINVISIKIRQKFGVKEFVAASENRSESEGGLYVAFVQRAISSYKVFANFKRHPSYQQILEHVDQAGGQAYLDIIKTEYPHLLSLIDAFKDNDIVGNPITFPYPETGRISPSTLRYIKVTGDLEKFFGKDLGEKIVEIGVGYGGQLLINDRLFKITEYHLFDLPPVLCLVSKYLESHILNTSYVLNTLNQCNGNDTYDLVISNYAFSELPSQLQLMYIKKVLSKAQKGYLIMNSGLESSAYKSKHLSLDQLRALLPPFQVLSETPETAFGNYVIVWGQQ